MALSKTLAIAAASALAVAPVAAQAGTRAGSSPVSIEASRAAAPLVGENDAGKFSPAWILLFLSIIAALIASMGGGRSRG